MATSPEFNEAQLTAARKPLWYQAGAKLATLDEAREFIERFGLVAFAPARLVENAPSLVEATLGERNEEPSHEDARIARDLLSQLSAEGSAMALNLLGGGGDTPDFVVSGAAFKYIYTLRGDKVWKLPPASTALSPLALRVFEALTEKGAQTAAELANELGREVTEAAIVRALNELWQTLRVLPRLGLGDDPTLWELTNKRFTKAIKAAVNSGLPTAVSALISLYLAQSLAASEDELETFLSPLAPRSRIREVVHALRAARELNEVVVAGKTLLYVTGDLPEMPEIAKPPMTEEELAAKLAQPPARFSETEAPEPGRIRKFERDRGNMPVRKPAGAFGRDDRERRPFQKRDQPAGEFTKPWNEEGAPGRDMAAGADGDRERRPFAPRKPAFGARKPFAPRAGGDRPRPAFGAGREGGSFDRPKRPYTPRAGGDDRPKRPYTPRGEGDDRPKRPYTPRAGGDDRPKRPYTPREGGDRPSRSFGAGREGASFDRPKRPYTPRAGGDDRPKRPYTPRGEGEDRPKRAYTPRTGGSDRPSRPYTPRTGGEDRPKRPYTPRTGGDDRPKRPYTPRAGGSDRPSRPYAPRTGGDDRPKRPYTPRAGGSDRPSRPYTPRTGGDDRPKRPYTPRAGGSDRPSRPYTPRTGGDDRPKRPYTPRAGGEDRPPRKTFGGGGGGAFKRAGAPGGFKRPGGGFGAGKPRGGSAGAPFRPKLRPEE